MRSASTIGDAVEWAAFVRWRGLRCERRNRSLARPVVSYMEARRARLDDITADDIHKMIAHFQARGEMPGTVKARVGILRMAAEEGMKATPPYATKELPRVRIPRLPRPKWWLRPEDQDRLSAWLRAKGTRRDDLVADYVDFVCRTGVRVEEALRLTPSMFVGLDGPAPELIVPGTKTDGSQRILPISEEAASIARRRIELGRDRPNAALFPMHYRDLRSAWVECRKFLGADSGTATLRALRRTFARYWTTNGGSTELLRDYLRHGDISTTAGYLRLVGGYDNDTLRRYL